VRLCHTARTPAKYSTGVCSPSSGGGFDRDHTRELCTPGPDEDCTLEQFASTLSQHEAESGAYLVPQHDTRSTVRSMLRLLVSVHTVDFF